MVIEGEKLGYGKLLRVLKFLVHFYMQKALLAHEVFIKFLFALPEHFSLQVLDLTQSLLFNQSLEQAPIDVAFNSLCMVSQNPELYSLIAFALVTIKRPDFSRKLRPELLYRLSLPVASFLTDFIQDIYCISGFL